MRPHNWPRKSTPKWFTTRVLDAAAVGVQPPTLPQRRIDLVFANHFHVEIVGLAAQREQGSGRLGHPLSLPGISLVDDNASHVIATTSMGHLITSEKGMGHLAELSDEATMEDVSETVRARFIKSDAPIQLPQRQSLATASRFAQLFYWMLESKHPLLLFGIPGVVLFVLGYRLSGDLATMFTELNSTSIGVTLITIAMTLIGLFAMMVALILYIMGKQVARIQNQYNWPKGS